MFSRIANTCAVMFTGATVGSVAIVAPAFASSRAHSPAQTVESAARLYGTDGIGPGSRDDCPQSRPLCRARPGPVDRGTAAARRFSRQEYVK